MLDARLTCWPHLVVAGAGVAFLVAGAPSPPLGDDAPRSGQMTRLDTLPIGDYVSVTGPAPWGEAIVVTTGATASDCRHHVSLFAWAGTSWWQLDLGTSDTDCALPIRSYPLHTEVTAFGPRFFAHDGHPRLEVELEARVSGRGEVSVSRTQVTCTVDAAGTPRCARQAMTIPNR
jgi:hypothetical protein